MLIHHIVTILLMGFSYTTSFFRIGAVIVLVHDVADIFLEVLVTIIKLDAHNNRLLHVAFND